jgi:hypothetical protein
VAHERRRRALSSAWTAVWPMVLGWRAATASTVRPGEVDGGARLAAWRWLRSGACEKASK